MSQPLAARLRFNSKNWPNPEIGWCQSGGLSRKKVATASGSPTASALAAPRSRRTRVHTTNGIGASQPVALQLSVIPSRIPQTIRAFHPSLAGANAAQANIQQLVKIPS